MTNLKLSRRDLLAASSLLIAGRASARVLRGSASPIPSSFIPAQDVRDTSGALVEAHHGGMIQANGFIYWVGLSMANIVNFVNFDSNLGINLYRCTADESDPGYLKRWTLLGTILQNPIQTGSAPWGSAERAHIVFNANTGLFVLGCHVRTHANTLHRCAFATTSNIESGWSWVNQSFDPSGHGVADFNMYASPDNTKLYLVYTGSPDGTGQNIGMYITQMDSTFVGSSVGPTNTIHPSTQREAPVLFDNGTNLLLITSAVDPWPATNVDADIQCCTVLGLDPIAPTWPSLFGGKVFPTTPPANGFLGSQCTCVFKPVGKSQYILLSDLWFLDGTNGDSSRYSLSPLTVTSTTVSATQPASWNIGDLT